MVLYFYIVIFYNNLSMYNIYCILVYDPRSMESVNFYVLRSMYYENCKWKRKQDDMANTAPIHKMVNTNIYI